MTEPPESIAAAAGSCEAIQWEISQAFDAPQALTSDVAGHLETCTECARFARLWRTGAILMAPPSADSALAQRVVDSVLREEPVPARFRVPLGRVAAALAFAALGWWLLNPRVSPPPAVSVARTTAPAARPSQAFERQIARVEQPFSREKVALHTAMLGGVQQVRDVLAWSAEALP